MQTMEKILVKKKKIALDRRKLKKSTPRQGFWGIISSVTNRSSDAESNYFWIYLVIYEEILSPIL